MLASLVFNVVLGAASMHPMNDPGILYSPYNWAITASNSKTINAGAYFSTIVTGQSVILNTDTTGVAAPYPQIWTKVDGGPEVRHVLPPGNPSINVSLCVPTCSASPAHLIRVIVKSQTETKSRWSPQSTAVIFTGIQSGPLALPRRKKYNVLIYGDSITEGVRTMGYQGIPDDTDRNDAVRDYSYQLYHSLPVEVGIVAFGGSGFTHDGSGGVPPLIQSYNQLWEGQPRSFEPPPDLVIYNEGTNDGTLDISSDFTAVVKAVKAAAPKCNQLLLLPFNGGHKEIAQVVAQLADPSVVFGNTTGFYDQANGLHPFGYNHVAKIAPEVTALALPLLAGHRKVEV